ncbi:Aste57867_1091 [Aphanomyces stellatus]|uniref:Aste57867_1091 protein n=1 Tax=Aphanomyces stellatus TaxID=120398 RepID=A0A485K5D9_9STRA|nr:hypothetical protein As57867_001090 [Aphanomyces stellatus]VFT78313.1 Aste57867_1091 [Aphanomyces stellatus]
MNDALLVYRPRKRPRKKPVAKLRPLLPPRLASKWHRDANTCFTESDLYLRWLDTTTDERTEALQSTWQTIVGGPSDKYRVSSIDHPPPLSSPDQDPLQLNRVIYRPTATMHSLAFMDTTPSMRLQKTPPLHAAQSTTWLHRSSVDAVRAVLATPPPTSATRRRLAYSNEMRMKLDLHLREKLRGNIWQDEVRSRLARPLDATSFVNRAELLDHAATSQSMAAFECAAPRDSPAIELQHPYSAAAHTWSSMIYRCYNTSRNRYLMKQALKRLVNAIRFLQDFFAFRVHCKACPSTTRDVDWLCPQVKARRERAVRSLVARRIQRPIRRYLAKKHASAIRVQCLWRRLQAKNALHARRKMHHAASTISRIARNFMWSQRRRMAQALRIQTRAKLFLWRLHRKQAEAARLALEVAAMAVAEKKAVQACMAHMQTKQGKAELKFERKRMKDEAKKRPKTAAPDAPMDLETLAIRHSFDAFDTDGSGKLNHIYFVVGGCDHSVTTGSIELDELRLLMSELGIPISERELVAGFQEMDADGSGSIGFDEFAAWWKSDVTKPGHANAHMALLRLKLRGQSLLKKITGAEAMAQAAKRITMREKTHAKAIARKAFRESQPPTCYCHVCFLSFALEEQWLHHVKHHQCLGRDVVELRILKDRLKWTWEPTRRQSQAGLEARRCRY